MNRRKFLKSSATAAGAMALTASSIPASVRPGGSGVVKIGMIGSGGRCSGAALQALQSGPDVKLVAMADVFEERLQGKLSFLKKKKPAQVEVDKDHQFVGFDGYRKVIDSVDAVLIACASKFHARYALAAIEAGKHVFVEKPHAIDPLGIRTLAEAAKKAQEKKVSLVSGLQSRYSDALAEGMKRVHDGAIGRVVAIEENFIRGPYQLHKRPPGMEETRYQFYNWYHFCWLSGDDVSQSLSHNMDRAAWALQEETPVRCYGLGGRSGSLIPECGDMFDHHTVVYEYKSGARVYAHCRTTHQCYNNANSLVLGGKGQFLNNSGGYTMTVDGKTDRKRGSNPYQAEQNAYIDSIRKGAPINNGDYMVRCATTTIMGQISCYTGKPVTWDQVVKSDFSFGPPDGDFSTPPPVKLGPDGLYPVPIPGKTKLL